MQIQALARHVVLPHHHWATTSRVLFGEKQPNQATEEAFKLVTQTPTYDGMERIGLYPQDALNFSLEQSYDALKITIDTRHGNGKFEDLLNGTWTPPSPVAQQENGNWLKTQKLVELNQRIPGNFWKLALYALTTPEDGFILKPLYKTGLMGLFYAIRSWQLEPEFYDPKLTTFLNEKGIQQSYDTVESQLALTIKLFHALGKTVAFDFLPHLAGVQEAQPKAQAKTTEAVDTAKLVSHDYRPAKN